MNRPGRRIDALPGVTLDQTSQQGSSLRNGPDATRSPTTEHGPVSLSTTPGCRPRRLPERQSISPTSPGEGGARRQRATKGGAGHRGNLCISRPFG